MLSQQLFACVSPHYRLEQLCLGHMHLREKAS